MRGKAISRVGRWCTAGLVVIVGGLTGCGGGPAGPDEEQLPTTRQLGGKADSAWVQLTCDQMDCEYGCRVVLACGEGSCFEVPACISITEALCQEVTCPEGSHCEAHKAYCFEADCPREVVECLPGPAPQAAGSCHCDALCSLPEYDDCCSDCAFGDDEESEETGWGTTAPQDCQGLCWTGAKCTDFCPPGASCTQVSDNGQTYWQVWGC